jgi:hypothetical protein
MNRRLIIALLLICMTSWSLMSMPLSADAHEDEAYIELNVTQTQPGTPIEIRGGGFQAGDTTTIMLMLVSSDRPQVLGMAVADDKGDIMQVVALPAELTAGAYEVRVADTHHVATAELSIVTDSSDGEAGSQRGEDEPLLAPIPTRAVSTGGSTTAPTANTPASLPTTEVEPPIPISLLFSSALAVVILIVGLFVITRRSR